MSATLDGARVAALMDDAPVIELQGRAFPVETRYLGRDPRERIDDAVLRAILRALAEEKGSILVFLPGQAEITRLAAQLGEKIRDASVDICPLYGAMDRSAQDRAIKPAAAGRRKIVLATSIAETSLTIDGVRVVIDSGLVRAPRFEPDLGLTRLETLRVSRAAADQRRGRAGRTAPGVCYRLWEEAATGSLPAFAQPEIVSADLSGTPARSRRMGRARPGGTGLARSAARPRRDRSARAAPRSGRPRRGRRDHAARKSHARPAAAAAPRPHGLARRTSWRRRAGLRPRRGHHRTRPRPAIRPDLGERLDRFERDFRRVEKTRAGWRRVFAPTARVRSRIGGEGRSACAFARRPGRAGLSRPYRPRARRQGGEFLMANGRAASVEAHSPLARVKLLAVAEVAGRAGASRILAAAELDEATSRPCSPTKSRAGTKRGSTRRAAPCGVVLHGALAP